MSRQQLAEKLKGKAARARREVHCGQVVGEAPPTDIAGVYYLSLAGHPSGPLSPQASLAGAASRQTPTPACFALTAAFPDHDTAAVLAAAHYPLTRLRRGETIAQCPLATSIMSAAIR